MFIFCNEFLKQAFGQWMPLAVTLTILVSSSFFFFLIFIYLFIFSLSSERGGVSPEHLVQAR